MRRAHIVYCYRNKINDKCYIGITLNPIERQKRHKYLAENGNKGSFYCAIRKHGWETFEYSVLETGLSLEDAQNKERFYIATANSFIKGYNRTIGGNCSKGALHTEDAKYRIGEAHKGLRHTEKTKARISTALTGRVFSEETLAKMSVGQKKRVWGPKSEETKQKMRKPKSPEHKAAMKAAWELRRAKKKQP